MVQLVVGDVFGLHEALASRTAGTHGLFSLTDLMACDGPRVHREGTGCNQMPDELTITVIAPKNQVGQHLLGKALLDPKQTVGFGTTGRRRDLVSVRPGEPASSCWRGC